MSAKRFEIGKCFEIDADDDGGYCAKLMCNLLFVNNDGETVTFVLRKGDFSDMEGAIDLALILSNSCVRIFAFNADGIGAYYTRMNTLPGWTASPIDVSDRMR